MGITTSPAVLLSVAVSQNPIARLASSTGAHKASDTTVQLRAIDTQCLLPAYKDNDLKLACYLLGSPGENRLWLHVSHEQLTTLHMIVYGSLCRAGKMQYHSDGIMLGRNYGCQGKEDSMVFTSGKLFFSKLEECFVRGNGRHQSWLHNKPVGSKRH